MIGLPLSMTLIIKVKVLRCPGFVIFVVDRTSIKMCGLQNRDDDKGQPDEFVQVKCHAGGPLFEIFTQHSIQAQAEIFSRESAGKEEYEIPPG